MRTRIGIVAACAFVCAAAPAIAHHGVAAEYDLGKKVTREGVVKEVTWLNPHMRVYIDVTDASGKVTTWNMEMTAPNQVLRYGWTRQSLLPGEKVVFEGFPGRVVESRGALARIAKRDAPDKPLFGVEGPEGAQTSAP